MSAEVDSIDILFQHVLTYTSMKTRKPVLGTALSADLETIDDHIQNVTGSLDDLSLKFSHYAADLKTKRNMKVAISKFPPEILSDIFKESLKHCYEGPQHFEGRPTSIHTYYPSLDALRLVCKAWRLFIDSTPAFWFIIDIRSQARHLEAAIRNSGSCGLWVYYDEPEFRFNAIRNGRLIGVIDEERINRHLQALQAFFGKISEQIWRWKLACIDGSTTESVEDALSKPAPLLQVLYLYDLPHQEEGPRNLLGGDAPSLRDVSIRDVGVDLSSPIFRGLEYLKLVDLSCHSVSNIYTILSHSAGIRSLVLDNVDFTDSSSSPFAPVDLPYLETIHLFVLHPRAMQEILQGIKCISERCSINIELYASMDDVPGRVYGRYLLDALQHLGADLRKIWSYHSQIQDPGEQTPNAVLSYDSEELQIDFGDALKVTLRHTSFSLAMAIDALKAISPLTERWKPAVYFDVELTLGVRVASVVEAASQSLRIVRMRIGRGETIEHGGPEYSNLIDILDRLSSPDPGGHRCCPNMTALVLHVDTQGHPMLDEALLQFAKRQCKIKLDAQPKNSPSDPDGTPKPFKLVTREIYVSREAGTQLYKLLGKNGLEIHSPLYGWEDGMQIAGLDWNSVKFASDSEESIEDDSDDEL